MPGGGVALLNAVKAIELDSLTQAVDAGRRAAEEALVGGGKEALERAQRQGASVRIAAAALS